MNDRSHLLTEQRLADSMHLDAMSIEEAVALMNAQDAQAVQAVSTLRTEIGRAIELAVKALRGGGRILYVGAGTSGRLGVLDAAECPPTFRTDPSMVQGIIAGGDSAMFRAQEGAEDRAEDGAAAIVATDVSPRDLVIGIAAGGTTPFVHGALRESAKRQAATVFLTCVEKMVGEPIVDVIIRPLTGPEVITGSTRLKAGTATKLVLNTISTVTMVQLGKVYENLMVDLRATNEKLWDRGARIVATLTGLERVDSLQLLRRAEGHVKLAVLMHRRNLDAPAAQALLERCDGMLRRAMQEGSGK